MHFLGRQGFGIRYLEVTIQGADSSGPILTRRVSSRFLAAKLLLFPRLHTACDPFEIFKPCTLAIRRAEQLAHKTARIAHFFYEFLQRQLGVVRLAFLKQSMAILRSNSSNLFISPYPSQFFCWACPT
jgi:hypothetical protein